MTITRRDLMTVGELSRRTDVSIKNLRQYTDWGLIYSVGRSATGYRLYDSDALWCVKMIGTLRALGLTLAEIRELDHRLDAGQPVGRLLTERLRASRARTETRIAELRQTVERIDTFEATHQVELADATDSCWTGDPRCEVHV